MKILMEGSEEVFDPAQAMEIVHRDIDLALANKDFALQPFPEFAAAFIWFSLNVFRPFVTEGMDELLTEAQKTLKKRMDMKPGQKKDAGLMRILDDLQDELQALERTAKPDRT